MLPESERVPQSKSVGTNSHFDYINPWVNAMATGLIAGKPFSPEVIEDYHSYIKTHFKTSQIVSLETLKAGLMKIPVVKFATREHYFKALVCFGKFLIAEGILEDSFLTDSKRYKPRRHLPPKRLTVDEEGLQMLLSACESLYERALLTLLSNTGLRATELCNLKVGDLELDKGYLTVRLGKGNKSRVVGLNQLTVDVLRAYLRTITPKQTLAFVNNVGLPLDRNGLYQRLERIGKKSGVKVNPHALRRAFVTINANKGRPLQMLQMACGHSSIKTTMGYCQTSELELIEAMKGW
jgi:integrase/recombinase XerD